ncbi:MAG TPA: hypothetical protein PL101_03615 [Bacteroidales bacterium]|jgi:hypothetical protein|nr:hypothetical protein [Bacteroidales bacterium]
MPLLLLQRDLQRGVPGWPGAIITPGSSHFVVSITLNPFPGAYSFSSGDRLLAAIVISAFPSIRFIIEFCVCELNARLANFFLNSAVSSFLPPVSALYYRYNKLSKRAVHTVVLSHLIPCRLPVCQWTVCWIDILCRVLKRKYVAF